MGALVRDIEGCEEGGFDREGRRSVLAVDGEIKGNEDEDFVRCGPETIESLSEYVESTDSCRPLISDVDMGGREVCCAGDVCCPSSLGPSSLTPPNIAPLEDALLGGGRLGLPGGTCCLGCTGLEKSIEGDEFTPLLPPNRPDIVLLLPSSPRRPDMVLLLPSSVRRGWAMGAGDPRVGG